MALYARCPTPCFKTPLTPTLLHSWRNPRRTGLKIERTEQGNAQRKRSVLRVFPFDQAWSPNIDQESLAPQLFAVSLFPYLAFLYFLTRSNKAPRLMLFGFYFLLVFVGVSIPAGIYAKVQYNTSLSNVDWLHGGAEFFLTLTNLFIVLGLREAIREAHNQKIQDSNLDKDSS